MNVKILNQVPPELAPEANSAAGRTRQSAGNALGATEAGVSDTATISSASNELSGEVPFRHDRVEALRAQVESGTYTVNPHAVATAMLQNLFRN
jgi:flagellar biosynthesis anti-sigma factor FlgM